MRRASIALLAFCLALAVAGCGSATDSATTSAPIETLTLASATPSAPADASGTPSATISTEEPTMPFSMTSTAFVEGGSIPRVHTCDGDGVSPALAWTGAPDGTVSLALIVDDPDAGGFIHWVAHSIDPASGSLPEGVSGVAGGLAEGRNTFGGVGYGGPCPPSGSHRYVFRLLALDVTPTFKDPPTASDVRAAAAGHILDEATLTGTYRRGG